jgi:hypothetical protein
MYIRPWWDSLEDFVIYGLILLGLIVRNMTNKLTELHQRKQQFVFLF